MIAPMAAAADALRKAESIVTVGGVPTVMSIGSDVTWLVPSETVTVA